MKFESKLCIDDSRPICDNGGCEIATGPYIIYIGVYIVLFIIQLLILTNTIYHEISYRHHPKFKKVRTMRLLYIALQISGIIWLLNQMIVLGIDPHTHILRDSAMCGVTAYSIWYFPGIIYGFYLFSIQIRLETSFRGSYLELSKWKVYTLRTLIIIIPIASTTSLLIDVNDPDLECLLEWSPNDIRSSLTYCIVDPSPSLTLIAGGCILLINALNISLGVIFTLKLRQFVKLVSSDSPNGDSPQSPQSSHQFKLEALIIKNNILTIFGILSSTVGYALYISFDSIFLFIDAVVNTMIIGLMFYWNERYYKRLCRPCMMTCFKKCDPERNHSGGESDRGRRLEKYTKGELTETDTPTGYGLRPLPRASMTVPTHTAATSNSTVEASI